ncbi:efflux RND transporter periplasmic adaptor subunit [Vibrio europaeus]|uniref:Efflux RND transporter periplasmic adaptor subunit n=1 Tax=Vibrio europaeus TaxID=300876 RepID=A0A178J627_9VIBR|nr:efflux RND transporter periplasmic adaptor subunit [Vibrio europaeus]MDC5705884.1 efflux RND transporter periplasmic adaptor subunit [Vibrio europaeus]MDC5709294.1 efflux RND transporter periplasmic adaptor subunit [Vibrio europaeus]MDC5713693.1 efflux RND transporter periplasmic adaptor subunit [Vibrio europaeus]MDC5720413.1 efflux RND transporter periplasmic adaptor subunit [Vibrio europaeus]MDC5723700.1 efflux RND transporter periplasmic adaptor subunit [Vibrio europaeus]
MKVKSILAVALGVSAIFAALVMVDYLEPQPTPIKEKAELKSPVSIIEVTPQAHKSSLTLLATTAARWPIQLKASSTAQLAWLDSQLEPGMTVAKGDVLAKLETSALASNLAQAKSQVTQAELNLKQAKHEQTVALKMLSAKTSSPFARREPQVAAAKAELDRAQQALQSANKLLSEANIVAPFDAIILRRMISPGEWLESGQVLFELAASDSVDVALPVSDLHWQKVQGALSKPEISVSNRAGQHWPAKVRYVAPQADANTRQRQVVLAVSEPYAEKEKLLPNQQVKVEVSLGNQQSIATLPLSALTRDGFVWTLDNQDRLQKEWVTLVGQQQDQVFVRFDKQIEQSRRVVVYPLISMLVGKQMAPHSMTEMTAKLRSE